MRTTPLTPSNHDGTSQRARALPALDPGYAPIDERTTADWIEFVREFAAQLPYFTADKTNNELEQDGNWSRFVEHPELTAAQIVEYIADPSRFDGEQARWLGRPHFALLLTFLELLGHAREQLNGFTRRHLDYFYREVLRMRPLPARPDRVTVFFRLANRVENCRLPAGTLLDAGRDGNGVPQHYRTEHEIVVNRAEIASIRSLYVDRRGNLSEPGRTEWRNLYAYEDATQCLSDAAASSRWKTFGKINASDSENPPPLQLGWAIRSPALSLKEGRRKVTLTLVLSTIDPSKTSEQVRSELNDGWLYQASAGKDWIEPEPDTVTIIEQTTNGNKLTVTLKIVLVFATSQVAISPRSGDAAPTLRALLSQRWDTDLKQWTTRHSAFETLRLESATLHVGVDPSAGAPSEPVRIEPGRVGDGNYLLHVHPFGESPLPKACPFLFPRYENAGELYIGLRNVEPPQNLPLLFQFAEGTSDPNCAPTPVSWDVLDGNTWKRLIVNHDSSFGFLDSGIVELALPTTEPSTILPPDLYWIRASVEQNPAAIADTIGVHAQAVAATFAEREDAVAHYASPLAPGKVTRLVKADARIAKIEQPYSSRDARPPESPDKLNLRVSERLRHKQRALTPWDYERLVLQEFPQIYKAKCIPASMEAPGLVKVIVVPDIRNALPGDAFEPRASARLLAKIQEYLQERAPSTANIIVKNPTYVPVRVRLAVRFLPGQDEGFAAQRLLQDLNRYLSPWAYDEGADLEIGGRIYANSILCFLDRCDYVDYATRIRLFRNDVPPGTDQVATKEFDEVLVSSRHHEIDVISDRTTLTGIGYMKIELDFEVAANPQSVSRK